MCGMANTTGHCDGEGNGESTKGIGQVIVTNYRMHPLEIALAASRERERILREALEFSPSHSYDCPSADWTNCSSSRPPCDCEWHNIRKEALTPDDGVKP